MISFFLRSFSARIISTRTSINEINPDIKSVYANDSFTLKSVIPNRNTKRSSVLALKQGMTAMWDKWGMRHALTVLQVDRCQVVQVKEMQDYCKLQLGVGERNIDKINILIFGGVV